MKKLVWPLVLILFCMGKIAAKAEGPLAQGLLISKQTFTLIQQLAQAKDVVADIEDQNRRLTDAAKVQEIQDQWVRSTELSDLVEAYRKKPSSQALWDGFKKEISLVDCFTLDAQGRVVGTIFKPHDFLQDEDPCFANCFNHGAGQVYVNQPQLMGSSQTVEIAFPVVDGSKTVGVLVATVLPER
jgi:hypothetical protein